MSATIRDYSVFDRLGLERKPVGVKFLPDKPEGIERLKVKRAMCEMWKEAQEGDPFYVQEEDFMCVEPFVLGMREPEPVLQSGVVAGGSGMFKEIRANRKLYQYVPKMLRGTVTHVAFASVDKMTFDPDVLMVVANVSQARLLLRSDCYTTGDGWSAHGTPVIACSWMYVYPVLTGKMNFTITGLSMGLYAINFDFPEGMFLISIPWNMLPNIMENLGDDMIYHDFKAPDRETHFRGFNAKLDQLRKTMPAYKNWPV